ncbi:MAG: hypothetical protein WBC33_08080 [Conexibacter sp.]
MNTTFTSNRQRLSAERVAGYGAEQRRLKAEAAGRRAAAALRATAGEEPEHGRSASPQRPPATTGRSQYLR